MSCEGPIIPQLPLSEEPVHAPAFIPSTPVRAKPSPIQTTTRIATSTFQLPSPTTSEPRIDAAHRARILAYDEEAESSGEEEKKEKKEEEKDANSKWANYKLQLSEVQRSQNKSKRSAGRGKVVAGEKEALEARAISLAKKMKNIEADYLFRKVDSEKIFREERIKLDASQLATRLSTTEVEPPSPFSSYKRSASNSVSSPSTQTSGDSGENTALTSDSSSVEELGEMFGSLLEMPEEETNDLGTIIAVRDMALPQKFTGKTPRANLEETVRKLDPFATVVFKIISSSRAFRASLLICWHGNGGRSEYFDMQDVACYDSIQAFNFIATIGLFSVGTSAASKLVSSFYNDRCTY